MTSSRGSVSRIHRACADEKTKKEFRCTRTQNRFTVGCIESMKSGMNILVARVGCDDGFRRSRPFRMSVCALRDLDEVLEACLTGLVSEEPPGSSGATSGINVCGIFN